MDSKNIRVIEVPVEVKQVIAEIDEKNPDNNRELSEKQLLVEILQKVSGIEQAVGIIRK